MIAPIESMASMRKYAKRTAKNAIRSLEREAFDYFSRVRHNFNADAMLSHCPWRAK